MKTAILCDAFRTVPDKYAEEMVNQNVMSEEMVDEIVTTHNSWLSLHLKIAEKYKPEDLYFKKQWEGIVQAEEVITTWDTGYDTNLLTEIGRKSVTYPKSFVGKFFIASKQFLSETFRIYIRIY